jgi:hypothetical protein
MLEKLGAVLIAAAVSIIAIPIAIALTAVMLIVASLPLRVFKATRDPQIAVGIPALGFALWTLWYGDVGFMRVMLQYGIAALIATTVWSYRDHKRAERQGTRAASAVAPSPSPRAIPAAQRPAQSNSDPVEACRAELEVAEAELERAIPFLPRELMVEVRRHLADRARTTHTVTVDGVSPRNVAWLVISNVAGEMVACGEHHVYRGVLSMSGKALQQAFLRAVDELKNGGQHDEAAASKDRTWLRERIKEAG